MRLLLMAAIRAYQRHISPHKGFACAYRVHTGAASCSSLGWRVLRRHGVLKGLALISERTRRCGQVHRQHHRPQADVASPRPLAQGPWGQGQRGVCDLPCDGVGDGACDLPDRCSGANAWRLLEVCDCCQCDWPRRGEGRSRPARRSRPAPPPRRRPPPPA